MQSRKNYIGISGRCFLHKLGSILVNNTDNLLLSSIVGIISNSLYSNYYLIIGSISQILHQLFRGIIASVGNLGVKMMIIISKESLRPLFCTTMGVWHVDDLHV